jgi:hypothetical protein
MTEHPSGSLHRDRVLAAPEHEHHLRSAKLSVQAPLNPLPGKRTSILPIDPRHPRRSSHRVAKLSLGLHNGANKAVVVGPHSLYGLVTALRKIRAPAGRGPEQGSVLPAKDCFIDEIPCRRHTLCGLNACELRRASAHTLPVVIWLMRHTG